MFKTYLLPAEMALTPTNLQSDAQLMPPGYAFTSPVNPVFSSSSDDNSITTPSEYTSEAVNSPSIYDALPVLVQPDDNSRPIYPSHSRRADLPKLNTSDPAFGHIFWDHPAVQNNLNIKLFVNRATHLYNIFKLSADRFVPISQASTTQILRLALWWFILARSHFRGLVLHRSSPEQSSTLDLQSVLRKSHVCIVKALWVLQESSSNAQFRPENGRHAAELHHRILGEMCKTITSIAKHGMMPEDDTEAVFSPDVDSSVWMEYPSLGLDLGYLLSGQVSSTKEDQLGVSLLDWMPLGNCTNRFYYTTLFVDVYIFSQSSNSQQVKYPAMLSIVRGREDPQISIILASQDGKLNLCVKPERDLSSTLDNVIWLESISSLEVRLPTGFRLQIRCNESDFRILDEIYQYHNNTSTVFERGIDEHLVFDSVVESVHCRHATSDNSRGFTDRVDKCRLRLFQKIITRAEGTGPQKMYRGSRIAILTPTTIKRISVLEFDLDQDDIIAYILRGTQYPMICLKVDRNDPAHVTALSFTNLQKCTTLLSYLTGCHVTDDEEVYVDIPLKGFSIAVGLDILGQAGNFGLLPWEKVRVINSKHWHEADVDVETSTTVLSESLRIVLVSPDSRITDRLNLGIGELRIRRNVVASGHGKPFLFETKYDLC